MLGSGISSASIWTAFNSVATAVARTLKARVLIAWTRQQVVNNFAIIGTSKIGGTDIVQGIGNNVLNDADLYQYYDETARLISLEYERNLVEPLGGAATAMVTIVLDNTDLRFTPNYNSTIGTALQPNRPMKLYVGFEVNGQEVTIQVAEALSLQPQEDKVNRTVTIQGNDFVTFLDGVNQETAIFQNQRSDQIIASILASIGIGSSNYTLDQGLNTIAFAGFGVGDFVGESIQQICEAEEGIFYQDEGGQFKFENRDKYSQPPHNKPVWTIRADDILEWERQQASQIINHIIVSGQPRSSKGEVQVWSDGQEEVVAAGQTLEVWAQFNDPVTALAAPEAQLDYTAFDTTGGAGSDETANITINVTTFTTTAKIEITNNAGVTVYVNKLALRGNPATVDYQISETYEDDGSVATYNEQDSTVDNDFIQDPTFAKNMAKDIVSRWKDPNDVLQIKIRGLPQLQLRDMVSVEEPDLHTFTSYRIVGIQGIFDVASFTQVLTLREVTANENL